MFINQDVIGIIFKHVNFFAIIGLLVVVFKKYILPDLLSLMAKKKAHRAHLIKQQVALEKEQQELDSLMRSEALLCESFKSKIDEWQKVTMLEEHNQQAEQAIMLTLIKKNHENRLLKIAEENLKNRLVDEVLNDVEKKLKLHFIDAQKSSEYLDKIVLFMDEGRS